MLSGLVEVLVCQHIACEPPGVLEDVMRERGWVLTRVELDEGDRLPARDRFDAIVVMGGPMGAYETGEHPWLIEEQRFLRAAVGDGLPVFGVCLGAQLLAASLGARVYPGPAPEVGVLEVELTAAGREDPVAGALPERFVALQWHGDTFELPDDAVLLAVSAAYPNQAFRVGAATYGVQFHLEVTDAMAAEWGQVPAYASALESIRGPDALGGLLGEFAQHACGMRRHASELFARWVELVERRLDEPSPAATRSAAAR
jgi:GMP synthase-like glutamine amidotransferase